MSAYVHVQYQPVVYYMRSIRHVRVCTCTISARGLLHGKSTQYVIYAKYA